MKKVLVICLMMLMVASVCLNASAADGGFVSSPSGNPAPTLVKFETEGDGQIVVEAYNHRNELPDALKALMERAYGEIKNCDDLTKLNADLAKVAAKKKIDGKNLAVSDLFDIHVSGSDFVDGKKYTITLEAETLNNFVGLLHMNKDGNWELIANAEVSEDGKQIKFSVDSFSPFAFVVNTNPPKPGDNSNIYIYAIIMVASAMALIFVTVKIRKQKQRV